MNIFDQLDRRESFLRDVRALLQRSPEIAKHDPTLYADCLCFWIRRREQAIELAKAIPANWEREIVGSQEKIVGEINGVKLKIDTYAPEPFREPLFAAAAV